MLVMTLEIIEGLVPGGGIDGGLLLVSPLFGSSKTVFGALNFSSILMPKHLLKRIGGNDEAYEIAMEDRIITDEERKFYKTKQRRGSLTKEEQIIIESTVQCP